MPPQVRPYRHPEDYDRVGDFLVRTYRTEGPYRNWLQPRWEYMHYHPILDPATLPHIGIWEDKGDIVAVVHHEHRMGDAYFEVAPGYESLRPTMLDYATEHLAGRTDKGPYVVAYIDDRDTELQRTARDRGFEQVERGAEPLAALPLDRPLPEPELPKGYRLTDLEQEPDILKIHRVMHRGFDHPGEPDPADLPGRRKMQSAPGFRRDLAVAVAAPDGSFASVCWMWFEPVNRLANVEPVCTDPDHRRKGLGKAAVLEGIRRSARLGATVAYVGSTLPIYRSVGFEQVCIQHRWLKWIAPTADR